jgi:hypothetical protein
VALNTTRFAFAERGATSVYKFRVGADETHYVWFEYGNETGSLHTTPRPGPYRVEDPLATAEFADLDALLAARATTRAQWVTDLMAQYGERLEWTYP